MNKNTDTGGPAFPCGLQSGHLQPLHDGMTLRDYFAAKAMQVTMDRTDDEEDMAYSAAQAYQMADAMLRAREAA